MAKIDINKLARMITEDPDVFLEYEGYSMSIHNPGQVAGDPNSKTGRARNAVTKFGTEIRHAERSGDRGAADNLRNELRNILDDLKYDWQNDPIASELID